MKSNHFSPIFHTIRLFREPAVYFSSLPHGGVIRADQRWEEGAQESGGVSRGEDEADGLYSDGGHPEGAGVHEDGGRSVTLLVEGQEERGGRGCEWREEGGEGGGGGRRGKKKGEEGGEGGEGGGGRRRGREEG